jgi:hypothetical protein
MEAIQQRDSMIKIFDSMPDAILLTKKSETVKTKVTNVEGEAIMVGEVGATHFDLIYCNKRTDELY